MSRHKNVLRIIGGAHRGRRLSFPNVKGLRPTADRVRETLFNWLQKDIPDACVLDLFAGSGALGLEALSRGAREVIFIEKTKAAANQLRDNLRSISTGQSFRLYQMDALKWLRTTEEAFDIVFIDPPFADDLLPEAIHQLEISGCLKPGSWIYCEQPASRTWPTVSPHWRWHRTGQAGQAKFALLQYQMCLLDD